MEQNERKESVMVDYFSVIAICLALAALIFREHRSTVVLTWFVSLVVSIKYLATGLDAVGIGIIVQASLLCVTLLSVTQGMKLAEQKNKKPKWVLGVAVSALIGSSVFIANEYSEKNTRSNVLDVKSDFSELGRQLLQEHYLSTELMLLLAFIVLVGLGLNLRKEMQK